MPELSIIIVSYNNKQVITDCLESIYRYNDIGSQLQVIVVEQSPDDSIFEFLKSEFPWVNTIRNDNRGFGAGNNVGAKVAQAPFLLFLNPDTILLEPICSFTVKKFSDDPQLGMFGVKLLDKDHHKNSSFMLMIPYGIKNKILYKICNRIEYFDGNRMYIQGADLFIRRDLFERIGGFDENIFMYCEETDLSIRINQAGFKIQYDPSKAIIHLEGKSTNVGYNSAFEKQILSFQYLCNKYNMPFSRIMARECRSQELKLLVYKMCRHSRKDIQYSLVKMIEKYI